MSEEPTFTLRAKDRFAPAAIEAWAREVESSTRNIVSGTEGVDAKRDKIKRARAIAHKMRAWQELHGCKIPD